MAYGDKGLSKLDPAQIADDCYDSANNRWRTTATGTFTPSGLQNDWIITTLDVGDTETVLPAIPLTDRNTMIITNTSAGDTLYIGPTGVTADNLVGTTSGYEIPPGGQFSIDVTDSIPIYGIAAAGITIRVKIMEVS